MDSEVTWVASHWLISQLSVWLQPRAPPQPTLPASRWIIKYLYRAGKDHSLCLLFQSVISSLCLRVQPSFFGVFLAAAFSAAHRIAHIPIKPPRTAKFEAIIHNIPEIAFHALAVLQRRCLDEQEVVRCHQYNKQGFTPVSSTCLRPRVLSNTHTHTDKQKHTTIDPVGDWCSSMTDLRTHP